jgi:hypothetical protein
MKILMSSLTAIAVVLATAPQGKAESQLPTQLPIVCQSPDGYYAEYIRSACQLAHQSENQPVTTPQTQSQLPIACQSPDGYYAESLRSACQLIYQSKSQAAESSSQSAAVPAPTPAYCMTTSKPVNMRTGPGPQSGIVATLPDGSLVQRHSVHAGRDGRQWAWATADEANGWIRNDLLSDCDKPLNN